MKRTQVTLTVSEGGLLGKRYVFECPRLCMIGRGDACDLQLPVDDGHVNVSRHHCLLEVAPPRAYLRDLGSRNGTFVNGVNIGQRPRSQDASDVNLDQFPAYELQHGDAVRLGSTVLSVGISEVQDMAEAMSVPMYFV